MPYYAAGDYYGRGDYYRGDPGIFGFLKKAAKVVAPFVLGGPLGGTAALVGGAVKKKFGTFGTPPSAPAFTPMLGAAPTGGEIPTFARGMPAFGRRRMNPMNVKALRRASRRIDGFARTARRALKHTPFILVSRASRGRRGSPGVITRGEAARALRK